VFQKVDHELDVRRHAPDAEFAQGAVHAGDGLLGRLGMGRDLDQQRIVVAGDDRPRIGRAAIQPDAVPGGRAIGRQAAIVRDEVVQRVFCRHPALQRVAVQLDLGLGRNAGRLGQGLALLDQDLGLDDVDPGHLLGHGVFDLHAGVHLDEVELLGVHIHQELDRARAFVVDVGTDALGHLADVFALLLGQVGRRGAFHDLLVPPLHGAVAFPQVPDVALLVAKDLHLDMAGALDHLFQIALAVAEGGSASRRPSRTLASNSSSFRIGRIPRPPPPQEAFSISG
jgi:hypothetical protein